MMKKVFAMLVAAALVAGLVSVAAAQAAGPKGQKPGAGVGQGGPGQGRGPGGPGQGRGQMMARLMDQIKPPLTADQKAKVKKLQEANQAEMKKLMDAPGDRESKREKFQAMRKKQMEALNKILTKPQQESLKNLMEEMRKRFQQGGRPGGLGRGPGGPPPGGGKPGGNKPPF